MRHRKGKGLGEMKKNFNFINTYLNLPQCFYTQIKPKSVREPKLILFNEKLALDLTIDSEMFKTEEGVAYLVGNSLVKDSTPIAQAYAGHQYGHFTMLGDGRAILLGEHVTPDGRSVDIQLKGAGKTPYSRSGDGRAVLGPMLREYLISEAMYGLGIPTTRSLAVVETGEAVYRTIEEKGAVLTRVASSHIRVGTFQYVAQFGTQEELKALADYTINRHFDKIVPDVNSYLRLLEEVVKVQATTIAKWQLVGFIHGVMNTDNMTLSGETIDYGPCAFMDKFHVNTVFSSIDHQGRYAYGNQPQIGGWNLTRLAEALLPLIDKDEKVAIRRAEEILRSYSEIYQKEWLEGMCGKLGMLYREDEQQKEIEELLRLMQVYEADFTYTFACLTRDVLEGQLLFEKDKFKQWYERWQTKLHNQEGGIDTARERMRQHNPAVVMRNHLVEEALDAAVNEDDYRPINKLLSLCEKPYSYSQEQEAYHQLPPAKNLPYRTFCGT